MPTYVAFLRAVDVGGRFVRRAGLRDALTNARTERLTGRTATWRDLEVVRAIDTGWGER